MSVESITCIYCLNKKPQSEFNREHVLPYSFGSFNNALVLNNMVCKNCNQYFGDNLDIILARGSMQGAMRYFQGVKPLANFEKVMGKRVKLAAKSKYDSDYRDAEIVMTPEGEGIAFTPGITYFSKSNGKEIFVSINELEAGEWKDFQNLDSEQLVTSNSDEDTLKRIQTALKQYNKAIEILDDIPSPQAGEKVAVAVEAPIEDELMNRAVAKIAFNYLAFTQGKEFVERSMFNPIRSYILNGSSTQKFVFRIKPLKLHGDTQEAKRRKGHVTTVDLLPDRISVSGVVEFFPTFTYRVKLGTYGILTIPLAVGHYYDIASQEVKEMRNYQLPSGIWLP